MNNYEIICFVNDITIGILLLVNVDNAYLLSLNSINIILQIVPIIYTNYINLIDTISARWLFYYKHCFYINFSQQMPSIHTLQSVYIFVKQNINQFQNQTASLFTCDKQKIHFKRKKLKKKKLHKHTYDIEKKRKSHIQYTPQTKPQYDYNNSYTLFMDVQIIKEAHRDHH